MRRYYLELNGKFVKDSNSRKTIEKYYDVFSKKFPGDLLNIYDSAKGEYIYE